MYVFVRAASPAHNNQTEFHKESKEMIFFSFVNISRTEEELFALCYMRSVKQPKCPLRECIGRKGRGGTQTKFVQGPQIPSDETGYNHATYWVNFFSTYLYHMWITSSSTMADRPLDESAILRQWVTLRLEFRLKSYVSRRPPITVGVRKLEWLPFRVVSKYPQCIVWFCVFRRAGSSWG